MDLANLAPLIAQHFGIQPSTLVFLMLVAGMVAKVVSRAIPDDATGVAGIVRRIGSVIAAETPNKITTGVSTSDAARVAIGIAPPEKVEAVREAVDAAESIVDVVTGGYIPLPRGNTVAPPTGGSAVSPRPRR